LCLQYFLIKFTHFIILLYFSSSPSWNSFSKFHYSIFIYKYKECPRYSYSFTLSIYSLPPTDSQPKTGPILPSCPSIFKWILIIQGSFALVFQICIYHTLIRLTPSITYSFSIAQIPSNSRPYACFTSSVEARFIR
jgi:hypothetical protein